MTFDNLRVGLAEIINDLHHMLDKVDDAEQEDEIFRQIRSCSILLNDILRMIINKNTKRYKKALAELQKAENATKDALKDIKKVSKAINQVAKTINAVARVGGAIAGI